MSLRIAINGFGRIGRAAFRAASSDPRRLGERLRLPERLSAGAVEVVAVNDLGDGQNLANLLKYDSVYGVAAAEIAFDSAHLIVDDRRIPFFSERDPEKLPWRNLEVAVVLEATGAFEDFEKAGKHLEAGAERVIITAPAKGYGPTVVLGTASAQALASQARRERVFSSASCTTNCVAPIMQLLQDRFGVSKSLMTTTHAYTATQSLVDGPSDDARRARAAALNIVPTSTGAAKTAAETVPGLTGKFDGVALRVPVACGSIADLSVVLSRGTSVSEVNQALAEAAESEEYQGLIGYSEAPLVSSDIIGDPRSAVVDGPFTRVVGGDLVKILAWYDNEWAYSCRLVELSALLGGGELADV